MPCSADGFVLACTTASRCVPKTWCASPTSSSARARPELLRIPTAILQRAPYEVMPQGVVVEVETSLERLSECISTCSSAMKALDRRKCFDRADLIGRLASRIRV